LDVTDDHIIVAMTENHHILGECVQGNRITREIGTTAKQPYIQAKEDNQEKIEERPPINSFPASSHENIDRSCSHYHEWEVNQPQEEPKEASS